LSEDVIRKKADSYEKASSYATETSSQFSGGDANAFITSVPQAPTRRMSSSDKALMNTSKWSSQSDLKLEDPVSLADSKSVVLQGIVSYVGKVHFDSGVWVGIQLTGPSVGKGYSSGAMNGKRYFANVGRKNAVFAPIAQVQRRIPTSSGDKARDRSQRMRKTTKAQIAEVKYVESLKKERTVALLKADEQKPKFSDSKNRDSTTCESVELSQPEPPPRSQHQNSASGESEVNFAKLTFASFKVYRKPIRTLF